jgi:hypothetical protein
MPSVRCLLLASSVLVLTHIASAQTEASARRQLRLSWVRGQAAASCPDGGHVEADVEQRLGWSPFVHSTEASESVEALVTRADDTWHAAIQLRAADGTSLGSRDVESSAASCASLAAAAGLAIALMIEPLLPAQPAPRPAPIAKPAPKRAPEPEPEPLLEDNSESASAAAKVDGSVALGALAVNGVLPRFALGVTLTGSVRIVDQMYGAVSASLLPEQRLRRGGADVGFGMSLGGVGACYRVPVHRAWSVAGCASILLASLEVTVLSPQPIAPGARFWWAGSAGLQLGWHVGAFDAALAIDALAHFARHSYLIDGAEPASSSSFFVEPAVAAAGSLVAGVHY